MSLEPAIEAFHKNIQDNTKEPAKKNSDKAHDPKYLKNLFSLRSIPHIQEKFYSNQRKVKITPKKALFNEVGHQKNVGSFFSVFVKSNFQNIFWEYLNSSQNLCNLIFFFITKIFLLLRV